jgi:phosphoserine aminotransferase
MPKCRGGRALSIHGSIIPPIATRSEIVVVFDTEDTKKAKEFAASADLKEAMMAAGVIDTPTIYFLESID